MGYVYWQTNVFYARQLDETIRTEVRGMIEQYRLGGLRRLNQIVVQRSAAPGPGLYLIVNADGEQVAGNLGSLTSDVLAKTGRRIQFQYQAFGADDANTRVAYGQLLMLSQGYRLFVGRDMEDRRKLEQIFASAFLWGIGLIAVIGVLGGLLVSHVLLRRIRAITDTSQRIMHGDLSQRVPSAGTGDELDRLAQSLNTMLDRIEQLINGLREVSDNIAHDLKTPLTRMRNRIDTVLREVSDEDETAYRETLIQTIEEADELIRTFNALLSIAKLEAGAQIEDLETFDLAALAGDAVELYEPVAEGKGIKVFLDTNGPEQVTANRQLLAQATANLIDNAIKYAEPHGACESSIEIRVARERGNVALIVADNGPGIPEHARERALKRFTRLETSRSRPGSGLGLSLVAAVARVHHGRISLEDNEPGLRAVISLPQSEPGSTEAPT